MSEVSKFFSLEMFRSWQWCFHIDWSYQDQLIFCQLNFFYTLSAIGYMADVYWGKVKAEYSLVKTALFLGFFPVIVEGPICRWEDVEDTLFKNESVKAENVLRAVIGSSGDCLKR